VQIIGDIMQEMQITPSSVAPVHASPATEQLSALKSRLQEYSCGQLRAEDYADTTDPWSEWPYCWAVRLQGVARERFHSFHQNQEKSGCEAAPGVSEYSAECASAAARAA
jgi:hypothetical protein